MGATKTQDTGSSGTRSRVLALSTMDSSKPFQAPPQAAYFH